MNRAEIDRALDQALQPSSASELRPELARAIEARLGRDLTPVRPLRSAGYYAAGFALIFLAPVLAGIGMLQPRGMAQMSAGVAALIFGLVAICAGMLAVSLTSEMAPGSRRILPPAVLNSGILLGLAVLLWTLYPRQPETSFWLQSAKCLLLGLAFAVPVAALAWAWLRRGAVLSPAVSGAAAGLLGGLAGMIVLEIHCPERNAAHILAAHWGAALACAAIGYLSGWWGRRFRPMPLK